MESIQRHAVVGIGIIFCGLLGALAAHWLVLPTGAASPGVLEAESPIVAAGLVIVCLAIATVIAAGVGKLTNAAVGMFTLGAGVFVLARRGGTVVELAFAASGGGGLWLLAIETLLWAGLILLAAIAVFKVAGPLRDIEPDVRGRVPDPFRSREAWMCASMGVLVLPVVWLIAQSPEKGQAVAAVFLGSLVTGLAGRLVSPHVQPILLFAMPCVFGAIGHVIGAMLLRESVDAAMISRSLPNLSIPMPLDYAAGSLTGIAIGLGWARSMLHHEEHDN